MTQAGGLLRGGIGAVFLGLLSTLPAIRHLGSENVPSALRSALDHLDGNLYLESGPGRAHLSWADVVLACQVWEERPVVGSSDAITGREDGGDFEPAAPGIVEPHVYLDRLAHDQARRANEVRRIRRTGVIHVDGGTSRRRLGR